MPPQEQAFIDSVAPAAKAACAKYGVPASVTIAQAIDESGWGKSLLAREANNFFGVKFDHHLEGCGYVQMPTREFAGGAPETISADFERYSDAAQSFDAHASLLAKLPRYARAMQEKNDPIEFATMLYVCGYSTDPEYAAKLATLMTEFHLTDFDKPY